jgi:hypothetical protein
VVALCFLWSTQVHKVMSAGDKLAEFKLKKATEAVNSGKAQVSCSSVYKMQASSVVERALALTLSVRRHLDGNSYGNLAFVVRQLAGELKQNVAEAAVKLQVRQKADHSDLS